MGVQDTDACDCGNDNPEYKHSDRHRGYYRCNQCGDEFTVDYYA